ELLFDRRILLREALGEKNLQRLSSARLARLSANPSLVYVVVARSYHELLQEISRAEGGIKSALSDGSTFITPAGSYFASKPLGPLGKVAFVYPGMGSASPGVGAELFQKFPGPIKKLRSLPGINAEALLAPLSDDRSDPLEREAFARDARRISGA